MLPPASAIPIAATTTDVLLCGNALLLRGWSLCETTGAGTAEVYLRDGTNATGLIVAHVTLKSSESTRDYPSFAGIGIRGGLYLDVVAGTVDGAVWVNVGTRVGMVELVDGEWVMWSGKE